MQDEAIRVVHDTVDSNGHCLWRSHQGARIFCSKCNISRLLGEARLFEQFDCLTHTFEEPLPPIAGHIAHHGPIYCISGLSHSIQPFVTKRNEANRLARIEGARNLRIGRQAFYRRLPIFGTGMSESFQVPPIASVTLPVMGVAPAWIFHLHPHHKLWYVGGLVFCEHCGSMVSGDKKSRLQEEACNPAKAGGPQRRIATLKEGSLKATGLKVWPDGSKSSVVKVPKRFYPRKRKAVSDSPHSFSSVSRVRVSDPHPDAPHQDD